MAIHDFSKIKVGDQILRVGVNSSFFAQSTIERVTKTQIIDDKGCKYRIRDGSRVGEDVWELKRTVPADSDEGRRLIAEHSVKTLINSLKTTLSTLETSVGNPSNVEEEWDSVASVFDKLRNAVGSYCEECDQ